MGHITDPERSVLQDMVNYNHDFEDKELADIRDMIQRMKKFLDNSKRRDQERIEKQRR